MQTWKLQVYSFPEWPPWLSWRKHTNTDKNRLKMFASSSQAEYVFCFITICLYRASTDNIFSQMKHDVNMYTGTDKVWHTYISKLLSFCTSKSGITQNNLTVIFTLGFQSKSVNAFATSKYKLQDLQNNFSLTNQLLRDSYVAACTGCQPECHDKKEEFELKDVERASGKFKIFRKSQIQCFQKKELHSSSMFEPWCGFFLLFSLNRELALNLTLCILHFSSSNLGICDQGRLKVRNLVKPRLSFTFCGYHSLFNLYPPFQYLELNLNVNYFSYFNFAAYFSVISKNIVHNLVYYFPAYQNVLSYKFSNEAGIFHYKIQTKKSFQIILSLMSCSKYIVYDGPGIFSASVKTSPQLLTMSTFQCIVTCFQKKENDSISLNYLFYSVPLMSFTSQFINISDSHTICQTKQITLPTKHCSTPLCAICLTNEDQGRINVSVTNMEFVSISKFDCAYGGLVASEQLKTGYQESVTVCDNFQSSQVPQMMYSYSAQMMIVLYWYEPFSRIYATIRISKTKCKPVTIRSCELFRKCLTRQLCVDFDQKVNELADVGLVTDKATGTMVFNVKASECIVVQAFAKWKFQDVPLCRFHCDWVFSLKPNLLKPNLLKNTESQFDYQVMGIIERFEEVMVSTGDQYQRTKGGDLRFTSLLRDTFSVVGPNKHFLECHPQGKCSQTDRHTQKELFTASTEFKTINQFLFFTTIYAPQTLRVLGRFFPFSSTWVDIIIFHHVVNFDVVGNPISIDITQSQELHFIQNDGIFMLKLRKTGETQNELDYLLVGVKAASKSVSKTTAKSLSFKRHTMSQCYMWQSVLRLYGTHHKYISLPGVMSHLGVETNDTLPQNYSIYMTWFQQQDKVPIYTVNSCTYVAKYTQFVVCLKVSMKLEKVKLESYIAVLSKIDDGGNRKLFEGELPKVYSGDTRLLPPNWSWKQASQFCRDVGGTLPYLRTKEELHNIISMLKYALDAGAIEAIFIGLHQDNSSKVRHLCCLQIIWRVPIQL